MKTRIVPAALAVAYILSIWLAVVAIDRFGVVGILGTGLMAPAAVYVVGATLVLRDLLQDHLAEPRWQMPVLIVFGALVSAQANPGLALASGAAFLIAETLDYFVYTPLRKRAGRIPGILASNAVSIPVDSLIFLWLAFGGLEFFWGQVAGKSVATVVAVVVLGLSGMVRRR